MDILAAQVGGLQLQYQAGQLHQHCFAHTFRRSQPPRSWNRSICRQISICCAAAPQIPRNGNWSGPTGPEPSEPDTSPKTYDEYMSEKYGERGYIEVERRYRDERKRLWDNMRDIARSRYEAGLMPVWFKPEWLDMEEPPVNEFYRLDVGSAVYWENYTEQGFGGDEPPPPGGSGGGWWREDDPYWPLRDYGDHAMRWFTLGFAALLAGGSLVRYWFTADADSLRRGFQLGSVLAVCGMAMSDMQNGEYGAVAVKVAFGICAWLAISDALHYLTTTGHCKLGWLGSVSALMCLGYVSTNMNGLEDLQIPKIQDFTARLRPPRGDPTSTDPVQWTRFLGEKLQAYMKYRRARTENFIRTPKFFVDPGKTAKLPQAPASAAGVGSAAS